MSEKIKLGEIIDTIQGSQYPLDEQITENKEGYLRFLRISDYTKSDEPIRYVKYSGKELICEENEVVVVRYGNVGFIGYGKKGILANNLFVLRLKNKNFDSKYLYYYLNSPNINNAIVNKANSSTMPALTHKMIKELEIPVVDIEKQKSIVSRLNKIQKIIDIRKEQIEYFDELIKSQFVEMFENENRYVNLEDVCTFINGDRGKNYPSADKISKDSKGIPFINAGLLVNNTVDWENMNYISEETYNKLGSGKIQKDDILYCLRGSLGKHAIIDFDNKGAIASSLVILRVNQSKIQPNFLLIQLGMDEIIRQQNQANNGSSQPNLSASSVKKYRIKLPDVEMQSKFVNIVKQVDKQKFEIQKSLDEMQNLYESLMDQYFG